MEVELIAAKTGLGDLLKGRADHLGVGVIVRCDFIGPDPGAFVAGDCPQDKTTIRIVVFGEIELG